ncbi:3-(cis-5,6-dihydroxycyclohexa-1,3-dien-1-yl)propanoate dehydrogenase [Nevskia ramosa]|uniref:3-(cis-5,6-dihydroxycyclohexa-1, 3-dien-1-yl)propanoate dehydrogenase n=1 Tax=Nevskia ramosa TaxID=64002 RepID=UPI0023575E70|nr:3-(cis-5,6-dihydroxycyclohexa-1,3-dien-1-yl)propanoate dehydrogenase [Nevskia ramosa]
MTWLNDSVALITGGGSGLGRALVERFIDEGARVGVLERNADSAAALERDFGDAVITTVGDVGNHADNAHAVERTLGRFGRLDTFIANAAVFDFFQPLVQYEGDTLDRAFDELFSINVKGGLLGARAALPALVQSRGCIIFTLSNAAFYPAGGGPLYTSAKHALVGVVKQLAYELAPKVRVNGVAPGGMRTRLGGLASNGTASMDVSQVEGFEQLVIGVTPLRICPQPADYCGPYVLLASRANAGTMTGAIINADGGMGVRGLTQINGGEDL